MSWERSRSIPWDRIRQDVPDPDAYKSKVFRDLQRETTETDLDSDKIGGISGHKASSYSTGDLLKQAAFGACIGSITGAVFGFMDRVPAGDRHAAVAGRVPCCIISLVDLVHHDLLQLHSIN